MMRLSLVLLGSLTAAFAETRIVPAPSGPGAMAPSLASTPDGTAILSWLEPTGPETWQLQFSRFDATQHRWRAPTPVAQGRNWFVNWADLPGITPLSDDDWVAAWSVNNPAAAHGHGSAGHHGHGYHAAYSLTHDRGATWSEPQPVTGESPVVEFLAVLALGDNARGLAAWLDGRPRVSGQADQQALYAQTLLASGPDRLVDPRVCDCCQLALARVPDGALLAYRGRDADEVRDIWLARWRHDRWEAPIPLHADGWKIAACPVNGPRLASHNAHVAAAWYTAAQNQPRVLVKFSRDGGDSWGEPTRVDLGRPQGRVDSLIRADGSALVTWLELTGAESARAGGIYLRVVRPDGTAGEPRMIAATTTTRASGFPRLAPLPDGRVLLAFTQDEEPSRITTLLLDPNRFPSLP